MADRRNLKVLRAKNGLTQAQMSEKIGISRSIYSEVETGKRACSTEFLAKLQAAFHIPDADIWKYSKIFEESEE